MNQQALSFAGKVYGLERVTRIWAVPGATIYSHRQEQVARKRPGPLGAMSNQDLVGEIRQLPQASPRKISGLEEIKKPSGPCRCGAYMTRRSVMSGRRRCVLRVLRESPPVSFSCRPLPDTATPESSVRGRIRLMDCREDADSAEWNP